LNPTTSKGTERNRSIDNLRTFVVILVVLHHVLLAYTTWGELNLESPILNVSPVVDEDSSFLFNLIVGFNDSFFMSLMFFLSGLFVWSSLRRKGSTRFLKDRFKRLGIPFLIGATILMPLAYYASRLQIDSITASSTSLSEHWMELAKEGFGTAGPLWFVWVLLLFNLLFIIAYKLFPGMKGLFRKKAPAVVGRPFISHLILTPIAVALYYPLVLIIIKSGLPWWIGMGPFQFQLNRILVYFLFYVFGMIIGGYGIERTFLKKKGSLTRFWWVFFLVGAAFGLLYALTAQGFVVACTSLILGFTGLFIRIDFKPNSAWKNLSENSYGIYIVHYIFVLWCQYTFLDIDIPAVVKGLIVFIMAFILSWGSTILIRKIPFVSRII